MVKKRMPHLDAAEDSTDATAFRTAMRDVKPLAAQPRAQLPPATRRTRIRRPQPGAAEHLDEIMPLIATSAIR
jgi:hypothetical protein